MVGNAVVPVHTTRPLAPPSAGAEATYGQKTTLVTSHWDLSYTEELRAFAAAIVDGQPLAPMGAADEAAKDLAVICALFESAKEGGASGWRAVQARWVCDTV